MVYEFHFHTVASNDKTGHGNSHGRLCVLICYIFVDQQPGLPSVRHLGSVVPGPPGKRQEEGDPGWKHIARLGGAVYQIKTLSSLRTLVPGSGERMRDMSQRRPFPVFRVIFAVLLVIALGWAYQAVREYERASDRARGH